MKSIVDFTNEIKAFFATKQALANEAVTRSRVGAHNLIPMSLAWIKEHNTNGTWSGNVYSYRGVDFTINTDSNGNVTSINVNTPSSASNVAPLELYTGKSFGNQSLASESGGTLPQTANGYTISGGDNATSGSLYIIYSQSDTRIYLRVASDATISNKLVYPMIRLASDPSDEFTPYAMTNRELTENKANKTDLTNISVTGTTNNTGSTISKGTFFYLNGNLVKSKVDIANGANFTQNTNYENVSNGALNDGVKVYTNTYTTQVPINVGTSENITAPVPSEAKEILALICTGTNPSNSWDNYAVVSQVAISTHKIYFHIVGSGTAQTHVFYYTVLYR